MIEARELYFTYPNGVEALKGISTIIRDGEFLAIMGQNGAGKTTLVKHFNGLLKPTKGQVLVDQVDVTKVSVATLSRNVGFVFQNPDHQLFSETVEEEISFALRNFGFKEDVVENRFIFESCDHGRSDIGVTQLTSLVGVCLCGNEVAQRAAAEDSANARKTIGFEIPFQAAHSESS